MVSREEAQDAIIEYMTTASCEETLREEFRSLESTGILERGFYKDILALRKSRHRTFAGEEFYA